MNQLMVILERWVDGKERKLRIGGLVTRNMGHFQGVPHGAVQVAVVIQKEAGAEVIPHICLHRRSIYKKTDPGKWDIMGGHLETDKRILPDKNSSEAPSSWEDQELVSRLFWETAVREANEEVRLRQVAFSFTEQHLRCVGGIGGFETGFNNPEATNREISTFYLAFVPPELFTLREGEHLGDYLEVRDTALAGIVQLPFLFNSEITLNITEAGKAPFHPSGVVVIISALAFFAFWWAREDILNRIRRARQKEVNLVFDAFYICCNRYEELKKLHQG